MNIAEFLSGNQIYALLAKGVDGVKIIAINVVVARLLGPEIYGKYAYVIGLASILAIIAEFRLQAILVRRFSVSDLAERNKIFLTSGVVNLSFSMLGLALAFVIFLFEDDVVLGMALLFAMTTYIFRIPRFLRAFYISQEKNVFVAKSEFFSSMITVTIVLCAVYYGVEWEYLPFLRLLDGLFVSVFLFVFLRCFVGFFGRFEFDFALAKSLVKSSLPLVLSGVAMLVFQKMDLIMIRHYLGEVQVGIYSAASNYMMLFSLAPMVLSESLGPKIFRRRGEGVSAVKQKFVSGVMVFGCVMSFVMASTGLFLIPLLYGDEYSSSVAVNSILSFSPFLMAAGSAAGQLIVCDKTQGKAYWKSVWACLVNFVLNVLLIPVWGVQGAAVATVVGFLVANIVGHWFVKDYRYIFLNQIGFLRVLNLRKA